MVSDRDTIRLVVVATLGTLVAIMSTIIIVTISGHSGKETPTGIIKDTGKAGETRITGTQAQLQNPPLPQCAEDETLVMVPFGAGYLAELHCVRKDAIR